MPALRDPLFARAMLGLLGVCAAACSGAGEPAKGSAGPVEASPAAREAVESAKAKVQGRGVAVPTLAGEPGLAVAGAGSPIGAGLVERFEATAPGRVLARLAGGGRGAARVELPTVASGATRIERGGVSVSVQLEGAGEAKIEAAAGLAVYRGGLRAGGVSADLIARVTPAGTEDFVVYDERPAVERLVYQVDVSQAAGLRLVEGALELLDAGGAPRIRMAPPYVVGADGARHRAEVRVGCAHDASPRAPWGRPVTAPGAARCPVEVSWEGRGVVYPAVVDPAWTSTGDMLVSRSFFAPVTLADGTVLAAGGITCEGDPVACVMTSDAELYDPVSGTWAATASPPRTRARFAVSLLADGTAIFSGGYSGIPSGTKPVDAYKDGVWTTLPPLTKARFAHASVTLDDGRLLVVGGADTSDSVNTSEAYDPVAKTWAIATMTEARAGLALAKLTDGSVLALGGGNCTSCIADNTTERFVPATNLWGGDTKMKQARAGHAAVLIEGGTKVLVAGGAAQATAETYDVAAKTWTATSPMHRARLLLGLAVLPDGSVVTAGGGDSSLGNLPDGERFVAGSWLLTGPFVQPRTIAGATLLASGQVLLVGGHGGGLQPTSATIASTELFSVQAAATPCQAAGDCATGFCADGFCCDSACDGPCVACSLERKMSGVDGTCGPVAEGTDPDNDCAATLCDTTGQCDGSGACSLRVLGEPCGASSCKDAIGSALACDAAKNCVNASKACAPYFCLDTFSCSKSCGDDTDCAAGYYCDAQANTCQPLKDKGAACGQAKQCKTDFCVDGVCCDTSCDGACQACAADLKASGDAPGLCGAAKAGTNPNNGCADEGALSCKHNGVCDDAGACALYPMGAVCGTSTCVGDGSKGYNQVGDACNGQGTCSPAATTTCGVFACSKGQCLSSCTTALDCLASAYCDGNVCKAKLAPGAACKQKDTCASGFCVDGVCCDTSCDGACQACAAALKASGDGAGMCGAAKAGTNPNNGCLDEGAPSCKHNGTCSGDGTCALYPTGAVCGTSACVEDGPKGYNQVGYACNGQGTCSPNATKACGEFSCTGGACLASCKTSSDCLASAYCDGGVCQAKLAPGKACTQKDTCASGFCVDGVCCNTPCSGQCEACDVADAVGTCIPVYGDPHKPRAACDATKPADICKGTTCDGTERKSCNGFVGSSVVCSSPSCKDGLATLQSRCDGQGHCPEVQTAKCEPYVCEGASCTTQCDSDLGCAAKFQCDPVKHECVPRSGASCDGDHTLSTPGGQTTDCSPYKCEGSTCKTSCTSVQSCVLPSICDDASRTCVAAAPNPTADAGCSFHAGAAQAPGAPGGGLLGLGLVGLLVARRRRGAAAA
jgi:hypothetical protein